jgi:hypothetical protein
MDSCRDANVFAFPRENQSVTSRNITGGTESTLETMKAVYATTATMEPDLIAMVFRSHGIEVMTDGVAGLYPDGLQPAGQLSRILVHDARYDEALKIIREEILHRKRVKGN